MAVIELPLANGGIHRDFEAHVLQYLEKHKATMHGCPVWKVESKLDGGLAVWFRGPRDGVHWEGALRFNFVFLKDRHLIGNVEACGDAALQLLAHIASKPQPLIQRAQVH